MKQNQVLALLFVAAASACGDGTPVPSGDGGHGGGGGTGGSLGTGGAPLAGSGAVPGGAGSGTSGASSSGGGAVSGGASNGGRGGAGGVSGGTAGAGAGGVGAGSMGPGGGAGAGGTAGASGAGALDVAKELDGFRLECPCIDANHFGQDKQDNCDNAPAVDRQTHPKKVGGDSSVIYDVKLRVRGNTEPNTYTGGKLEQKYFYTGGQTSTPGYTAYMLTIEDPKQVYFFNYSATTGHFHFLIDYEVVIPMRGGTSATFEVNGGKSVPDGHGVSNREGTVVPDVPPAPEPFNGQLVQFDVVSVTPRRM